MAVGIGTASTVAFGTSSYTAEVLSFTIDGEEIPVIDMAHMGSTDYREKSFGTLAEPPAVTIEINFNPASPPPLGTVETATITWPDTSTLVGTGAIISRSAETPNEDKMTGTYVFQFDGRTGPTYA